MRGNSVGVILFLFYGVFNCSTVARSVCYSCYGATVCFGDIRDG